MRNETSNLNKILITKNANRKRLVDQLYSQIDASNVEWHDLKQVESVIKKADLAKKNFQNVDHLQSRLVLSNRHDIPQNKFTPDQLEEIKSKLMEMGKKKVKGIGDFCKELGISGIPFENLIHIPTTVGIKTRHDLNEGQKKLVDDLKARRDRGEYVSKRIEAKYAEQQHFRQVSNSALTKCVRDLRAQIERALFPNITDQDYRIIVYNRLRTLTKKANKEKKVMNEKKLK